LNEIIAVSNDQCRQHSEENNQNSIAYSALYTSASITVLQALAQIFQWFTAHPGTSKEAVSELLSMQHNVLLPKGNLLPESYYDAHQLIEPFLIEPEVFHACEKDCILYRKEHKEAVVCPQCNSPRYKHGRVAARKFTYLPLGQRILRMFADKNFSKALQSHPGSTATEPAHEMYDIHDSPAWKEAYSDDGVFKGDKRGISLAICTDGVNPFSHAHVKYSMWPIMVTVLNLPRNIRNLFSSVILLGIIPGNGNLEPKSLDPYLQVVTDELLQLNGQTIYDAYQESTFELRIEIILHVLDYPGIGKVFKASGSGAFKGCMWCDIKGMYVHALAI